MTTLTDDLEILKGSFSIEADADNVVTRLDLRYAPGADGSMNARVQVSDLEAEAIHGRSYQQEQTLSWVREGATATQVGTRMLSRARYPRLVVSMAIPPERLTFDLMDTCTIHHFTGPGAGRFEETITVTSVNVDLDGLKVDIAGEVKE